MFNGKTEGEIIYNLCQSQAQTKTGIKYLHGKNFRRCPA